MSKRITYNDWQKTAVYERHDGKCTICGCAVSKRKMTISHKIPLSEGGTNEIENLQLACWYCNQAKANLSMDEFYRNIWKIFCHNQEEIMKIAKESGGSYGG